ncbi:MAG TPA: ABC transporter ATP-binding protein [Candidatus Elarobacter sp.]|nr:ABC transporter ATP-binding protein [Candidatus Elarobacter sp.]
MSELLTVDALRAGYGSIEVLHDVSIALEEGTLCAIVGANGAGKTTLLMSLAGIMPTRAGHVRFNGSEITRMSSHARVKRGLVLVPEGRRMLPGMSVEENLQVAASAAGPEGFNRIDGLFDRFPILRTRRNVPAGSLSGGEQQMLAIARALAIGPKALLLDEPSMGLAPKLVDEIFAIVAAERARGTSILLVEQNARRALALADRAYVMERGRIVLTGTGAELATHRDVVAAYLGA